jgi:hypothetical protein
VLPPADPAEDLAYAPVPRRDPIVLVRVESFAQVAALFSVRAETINKRIRDIRQLLDQAGHHIQPGPHRLASLDDLYSLAAAAEITLPPEIKTAC